MPKASDRDNFRGQLQFPAAHVTFRGMPEPSSWTFESGVTDFGALDTEPVDLAKLLVIER